MPRLTDLSLRSCGIGDAGLVALAPALRRLRRLKRLDFSGNTLGDEGLATLVAPSPLPTGALAWVLTPRVLTQLEVLDLRSTQISDAGCAALASALDSGTLPALKTVNLSDIRASAAPKDAVSEALANSRGKLERHSQTRIFRRMQNFEVYPAEWRRHLVDLLVNCFLMVPVALLIWLLINLHYLPVVELLVSSCIGAVLYLLYTYTILILYYKYG